MNSIHKGCAFEVVWSPVTDIIVQQKAYYLQLPLACRPPHGLTAEFLQATFHGIIKQQIPFIPGKLKISMPGSTQQKSYSLEAFHSNPGLYHEPDDFQMPILAGQHQGFGARADLGNTLFGLTLHQQANTLQVPLAGGSHQQRKRLITGRVTESLRKNIWVPGQNRLKNAHITLKSRAQHLVVKERVRWIDIPPNQHQR